MPDGQQVGVPCEKWVILLVIYIDRAQWRYVSRVIQYSTSRVTHAVLAEACDSELHRALVREDVCLECDQWAC